MKYRKFSNLDSKMEYGKFNYPWYGSYAINPLQILKKKNDSHRNIKIVYAQISCAMQDEMNVGNITSLYFISFDTIFVVSTNPAVILRPNKRYSSPKHCATPIKMGSEIT